ncbi:selenocysteine-specific translation elongation factor [Thalassobacillus hwangdonensis]|uniref:Selenocysteine-specific elongation factor n=1 Tax=Thalassobacillus hwangdonensis TaxID=546108 RepID=A0ABW3KXM5_9BACI
MEERHYTIGLAGHIDHGKTALTKALTQIDTDRLKEEKERNISIEPGFAPLHLKEKGLRVSVIDVPGHERFIRQMIAGVAGIDLVLVVIAGDEGIMPQTKEHMDILSLLGVENAMLVVSKSDLIDAEMKEMVEEDIRSYIKEKSYSDAPLFFVDSVSGSGVQELEHAIEQRLKDIQPRDPGGDFRMPVDQVFSIKGHGTVVRGTIYEGRVRDSETVHVLPPGKDARIRQIQVHQKQASSVVAGQRAAINLSGVDVGEVRRGDVLVKGKSAIVTSTIDVVFKNLNDLIAPIKQRGQIRLHIGTEEVMGRIVFFDRNEMGDEEDEVYCQLRLEKEIVAKKDDRFIIRRPTPVETVGGGKIIDPAGAKYKYGPDTIEMLMQKAEGTKEELVLQSLEKKLWQNQNQLQQLLGAEGLNIVIEEMISTGQLEAVADGFMRATDKDRLLAEVLDALDAFHLQHPLRTGMNKPQLLQQLPVDAAVANVLIGAWVQEGKLNVYGPSVAKSTFTPHLPDNWKVRMEKVLEVWKQDGLKVREWYTYGEEQNIPEEWMEELKYYLIHNRTAWEIDSKHLIYRQTVKTAFMQLYDIEPEAFKLEHAKETFGVSRKYLIPLLEKSDREGLTVRQESLRKWRLTPDQYFK